MKRIEIRDRNSRFFPRGVKIHVLLSTEKTRTHRLGPSIMPASAHQIKKRLKASHRENRSCLMGVSLDACLSKYECLLSLSRRSQNISSNIYVEILWIGHNEAAGRTIRCSEQHRWLPDARIIPKTAQRPRKRTGARAAQGFSFRKSELCFNGGRNEGTASICRYYRRHNCGSIVPSEKLIGRCGL